MKNNKNINLPTVTVAATAYNEEKNIKAWLASVLSQEQTNYKLEKILIISDGSRDRTVEHIKAFDAPLVEVRDFSYRQGMPARLNLIYKSVCSDILIKSDADVVFGHNKVIEQIVSSFNSENNVMMACGHAVPHAPRTFTEKAVNRTYEGYAALKYKLNKGHNIFSVHGCISAFRNKFFKQIKIKENMVAVDLISYLNCISQGYKYRFIPEAIVYFRLPQTISDQLKQHRRHVEGRQRLAKYFPEALIKKEFNAPRLFFLKSLISQFLKHPLLCGYIFLLNNFSRFYVRLSGHKLTGKWPTIKSTK